MKSLQKTFDILEYVILQNGKRVTPSEAAAAVGINISTCTRIMTTLVNRGYLVHISRKEGYMAGPMIVSLNTRDSLFKQMANAAAEPIFHLSTTLTKQVNASILHGHSRVMLTFYFRSYYYMTRPWQRFFFRDHWDTATGRILISSLNDREAKKIIQETGGPEKYPAEEIARIRENGFVRFERDGKIAIGHAVKCQGFPLMALGFATDKENAEKAFEFSIHK